MIFNVDERLQILVKGIVINIDLTTRLVFILWTMNEKKANKPPQNLNSEYKGP